MKKTFPFVFVTMVLLFLSCLSAQTADTSVATAINTIFAPLEKNRIPHNILLDYGIELIDITKYDGVLRTDNYVGPGVYKDTYSTLVSSCTATTRGSWQASDKRYDLGMMKFIRYEGN